VKTWFQAFAFIQFNSTRTSYSEELEGKQKTGVELDEHQRAKLSNKLFFQAEMENLRAAAAGELVRDGTVGGDATVPAATVPAATVPAATVPAATVPAATVPAATVQAAIDGRDDGKGLNRKWVRNGSSTNGGGGDGGGGGRGGGGGGGRGGGRGRGGKGGDDENRQLSRDDGGARGGRGGGGRGRGDGSNAAFGSNSAFGKTVAYGQRNPRLFNSRITKDAPTDSRLVNSKITAAAAAGSAAGILSVVKLHLHELNHIHISTAGRCTR
jgi:hypothetical protein